MRPVYSTNPAIDNASEWQLDARKADYGVYRFDLELWLYLHDLSVGQAEIAANIGLCKKSFELLTAASYERLQEIAQPVFSSFSFNVEPDQLSDALLAAGRAVEVEPSRAIKTAQAHHNALTQTSQRYWLMVRKTAIELGDACAELLFGVTHQVLGMLRDTTELQVELAVATLDFRIQLRFPSKILIQMLEREHLTHHKLMATQAMVSAAALLDPAKRASSDDRKKAFNRWISYAGVSSNDADISDDAAHEEPAGQIRHYSEQYKLIEKMLQVGFVTAVIMLESGVTSSKIYYRIQKEVSASGKKFQQKTGKIPTGKAISSYQASIQASVLMLLYCRLAGPAYRDSVQIEPLMSALAIFESIKAYAGMLNVHRWNPVEPSLGFGLAQELRGHGIGQEAFLSRCPDCDMVHLTSIHQADCVTTTTCAFCRISDAERLNTA